MGPLDLAYHLLNFIAPALFVAGLVLLGSRFLLKKVASAPAKWKQFAINFVIGVAVLAGGLVLFGRDGKMATYAALVLAQGTVQWLLLRGWKR
ncbi:MAG: hypothetical protein K2X51_15370 [Burkholderiales bacterium]|nr:hypothetical protein [Burkholderiales bacterium]